MKEDFPFDHFLKIKDNSSSSNFNPLNLNINSSSGQHRGKSQTRESINTLNLDKNGGDGLSLDELEKIQAEVLNYLKNVIPEKKFNAFFESTFSLKDIQPKQIEFSVTTIFIKNMIEGHYKGQIEEATVNVLGKNYEVKISVFQTKQSLSSNKNNILN